MPIADIVIQGEKARLFPVVADTSKENRIASIFLALLPEIPDLAKDLLQSAGVNVGKRSSIECYTEVHLKNDADKNDRPDGLISVKTGSKSWQALIEFKIGKADLEKTQVERYLKLAKSHSIDAVITISNQFVARVDHPPVQVSKALTKKTGLFHWSWMSILTKCQLMELEDTEQKSLLSEFVRFLEHKSTGVSGFSQMNKGWKEIVTTARTGGTQQKSSAEVETTVAGWLEEQRDICLLLSRNVGKTVRQKIPAKFANDPILRLKTEISRFCEKNTLAAGYQVPDAASDIEVEADLVGRTIVVSMQLTAPKNRVSTKARVNWLLRMLKSTDERIIVRAHWPSRVDCTQVPLVELRENPEKIQTANLKLAPHKFEVLHFEALGPRFAGSRTFIEDLERAIPEFYASVGQYLKAWQPSPPKPVKKLHAENPETGGSDVVLTLTRRID